MRTRTLAAMASSLGVVMALTVPTAANADSLTDFTPFSFTALSGAAEVPGPGDPDGRGFSFVRWNADNGLICYNVFVRGIAPATAAHIHVGDENTAGPVVQPLEPPTNGYSAGCTVNQDLAAALDANPDDYYVNVHNPEYPAGAVRGQLG